MCACAGLLANFFLPSFLLSAKVRETSELQCGKVLRVEREIERASTTTSAFGSSVFCFVCTRWWSSFAWSLSLSFAFTSNFGLLAFGRRAPSADAALDEWRRLLLPSLILSLLSARQITSVRQPWQLSFWMERAGAHVCVLVSVSDWHYRCCCWIFQLNSSIVFANVLDILDDHCRLSLFFFFLFARVQQHSKRKFQSRQSWLEKKWYWI